MQSSRFLKVLVEGRAIVSVVPFDDCLNTKAHVIVKYWLLVTLSKDASVSRHLCLCARQGALSNGLKSRAGPTRGTA